jgi:DIM1 family U5 snRNP protein
MMQHLPSAWHVDQAIVSPPPSFLTFPSAAKLTDQKLSEESRIVCLRFGNDADPACMEMDEKLYKIADAVKEWAVIYIVDNRVSCLLSHITFLTYLPLPC